MNSKKLLIIGAILFSLQSIAQITSVDEKIREVFGDENATLVIEDKDRYNFYETLVNHRIEYVQETDFVNEKFIKLSSIALLNKYNSSLERDLEFDATTFNPLKYDLNFTSRSTIVYRIDNTPYLIVIKPQN